MAVLVGVAVGVAIELGVEVWTTVAVQDTRNRQIRQSACFILASLDTL
jgi:hypothetical protein